MFTQTKLKGLKPRERQYEVYEDSKQKGTGRLGVIVGTSGVKTFVFRFFWEGKRQFIQLGKFPEMQLTEAHDKAKLHGAQLKSGLNPKTELERQQKERDVAAKAEAMKGSMQQLIHGYVDKMKADGKRTYGDVLRRLEKDTYPVIPPTTKAKEVTPEHIKLILSNMIRRGAVVQSNRVRSYLHAAFQYGLKADNDPANMNQDVLFGLTMNPVSIVPKQAAAEKPGDKWLKLSELRQLIQNFTDTPKVGWRMGQLLNLCVYTGGQRPHELATSQWTAINWQERTWLITADRSKNKRPHLIPLTDAAVAILRELQQANYKDSPFIFPHGSDPTRPVRLDSLAQAVIYYRKANPDFTYFIARDLRRTCKTLMGEIGISKELRDRIQNHALQDVSAKHYDRYSYQNEKRHALVAWNARLDGTQDSQSIW